LIWFKLDLAIIHLNIVFFCCLLFHSQTETRSQVVDRINALVARREREGFEANETVRSWQKLLFDRIKWAL
jgi:hypothetical protein